LGRRNKISKWRPGQNSDIMRAQVNASPKFGHERHKTVRKFWGGAAYQASKPVLRGPNGPHQLWPVPVHFRHSPPDRFAVIQMFFSLRNEWNQRAECIGNNRKTYRSYELHGHPAILFPPSLRSVSLLLLPYSFLPANLRLLPLGHHRPIQVDHEGVIPSARWAWQMSDESKIEIIETRIIRRSRWTPPP
jgi:hypothetical protein